MSGVSARFKLQEALAALTLRQVAEVPTVRPQTSKWADEQIDSRSQEPDTSDNSQVAAGRRQRDALQAEVADQALSRIGGEDSAKEMETWKPPISGAHPSLPQILHQNLPYVSFSKKKGIWKMPRENLVRSIHSLLGGSGLDVRAKCKHKHAIPGPL